MQSELMVEEMMNAEEFEYAPKGLPMLLHQVNICSLLSFTMSIYYPMKVGYVMVVIVW